MLLAVCCVVAGLAGAQAERRVALIVGNASYAHIAALPNVRNDAKAVGALFKAANFDAIDVLLNLDGGQLRRALKAFAGRAADADVAVLYYAGHGIEVGQTNYLIPVDARLATDFDIEDETVPLDRVLQAMEPAKRLRFVILDACRENPFLKSMKRTVATRSVGRGLGRVEPTAPNTLIAFATKPNATAADGKGPNSPFTAALVKHLLTPGLDLRIALGKVRDEVMASTGGRQEPYVTSSLGGEIVSIVPGVPGAAPAAEPKPPSSVPAHVPRAELAIGVFNPVRAAMPLASAEERTLRPGDSFKECDDCPEMVVVPEGSFLMGSPASERGHGPAETPLHPVVAGAFAIGKFEVTFAEWDACVAAAGCKHTPTDSGWGRGKQPVIDVSWDDISREYLPWLWRKTGKTYRLPTEAEWEYAARGGTRTPYAFGQTITTGDAQFMADETAEVGSFPANIFGLHDMHGNVWEWVQDCLNENYNGAPSVASSSTAGDCRGRIARGGSWGNLSLDLRSATRGKALPVQRFNNFGFRVVRTPKP